jgi:hypothetical protein
VPSEGETLYALGDTSESLATSTSGGGEGGIIKAVPTFCNAIGDALSPLGARVEQDLPPYGI